MHTVVIILFFHVLGPKFQNLQKNKDNLISGKLITCNLSRVHFMHLGLKIYGMELEKNKGSCVLFIVSWRTLV